ncbi:cytochrome P450 [Macrophomina phaseolina]|uniref:Cytochrome P450 n=1 Tax=Macrophomina phaseolina TaxID=35725 RepID=A0ABQ8G5W6_9PEZI|nr:cytochrome P450 [Macrophomina phaseolina]
MEESNVFKIIYSIFLHPLRRFPGPLTHAATRLPYCVHLRRGNLPFHIHALHAAYGPVVRVAPDELTFSSLGAWKDIMGHQHRAREFGKWGNFYRPVPSSDEGPRLRRALAYGFSDKAMREQGPLITRYVNLLVRRLHENCDGGSQGTGHPFVDNFTTFDLIGDPAFGESGGVMMQTSAFFPGLTKILPKLVLENAKEAKGNHDALTRAKLERRVELGKERKSPDTLAKLTDEIRSTFQSEDEININSAGQLKYMLAWLNEALRLYPPTPGGPPRVVPQGGGNIVGNSVPENTVVSVHMWAAYHDRSNFTKPFEIRPERHLGDSRFASDKLDMLQPFQAGPRAYLGRNLAHAEMRTILAPVIYNFDIKLAEDSKDWIGKQKIYCLWNKGPLNVYLTPVSRL